MLQCYNVTMFNVTMLQCFSVTLLQPISVVVREAWPEPPPQPDNTLTPPATHQPPPTYHPLPPLPPTTHPLGVYSIATAAIPTSTPYPSCPLVQPPSPHHHPPSPPQPPPPPTHPLWPVPLCPCNIMYKANLDILNYC